MTKHQAHPAADLFPVMQGEDFDKLVSDIRENGLKEPIILLDDETLDGRNREAACEVAGVEPKFLKYAAGDPEIGDPVRYVVSKNLHRRHLDTGQRSSIAAKLANMRQGERTDLEPSAKLPKVSQTEAADMMNVSERSVRDAKTVLEHGAPELNAAVAAGKIKISNAAEMAKAQTHEEQRKTLAEMAARENAPVKPMRGKRFITEAEYRAAERERKAAKRSSKGKSSVPRGPAVERKGAPDNSLAAKLDPLFAKLWQLSVDWQRSEMRDLAAQIERALADKGHVPASERIRDAKGYLAKLKPKAAREPSEVKSDVLH